MVAITKTAIGALLSALARPVLSATATAIRDLGRTVDVGNVTYYLPGTPETTAKGQQGLFGLSPDTVHLVPVTHVVLNSSSESDEQSLDAIFESYGAADDVWSTAFSEYVLVTNSSTTSPPSMGSNECSPSIIYTSDCSTLGGAHNSLAPGPYFVQVSPGGILTVYKAYRVYADNAGAFYYGVYQNHDGSFDVLSSASPLTNGGGAAAVAVPSRLYFPAPSVEKPLSGVRVGVKDLYDLKGLKTSGGSRAWFELYEPANATAKSIQYLIGLGAVVVGKTRTSQFANGEAPTADWVDFHDPFNARGDGYQDPSSSSAGAGSAESNYDWIDLNIGSDTGGSVRAPAAVGGVFGNRPSQYVMTLEGVIPMSASMDTPAYVARSAATFAAWGKAWYGAGNASLRSYPEFPKKLIYPIDTPGLNTTEYPSPGFFPTSNDEAQALYDNFTAGLEALLGTERTVYDFYTAYKDANGLYPVDQLGSVWSMMTSYEQYHNVFSRLSADWAVSHGGDMPYFDPPVRLNRDYGRNTTAETFAQGVANKTVFKTWLETEVLVPEHDSAHCSSALLIHPIWPGNPSYRDNYPAGSPEEVGIYFGWNQYSISQLGGVPEVVLPIGQVKYMSRVSETEKCLPVAVSINAAAGCDFVLYDLVEALAERGVILKEVKTGPALV
ncbi:amidase signature domain-containing protein [Microdochium trichocladiopsis]|uniref:Amidase signature domain-containing protein n=1 Tax=Microdochium trichocladiopsis TaxID=1682393 RepID=A0A9P8YK50_9PEZI|nr:amidase signature domain-containing protein [Microdochium trichocladiopsis]KAH7041373.1 amidase signature domain-containing protein [Microdochium trichocladiopsis]